MKTGRPVDTRRYPFSGRKMRLARTSMNVSSKQLGELLGCTGSTILNYERGVSKPKIAAIEAIERALALAPGALRS